jgi:hypothetical protein
MEKKQKQEHYTRHEIKADYESFRQGGMKDRKKAKDIQHKLNWFLGEDNPDVPTSLKYFPYEKHEYMPEDSTWGQKSNFRYKKFLDLDAAISQDSVFQELIKGQKEFYRNFPFTTAKDTAHWEKYKK